MNNVDHDMPRRLFLRGSAAATAGIFFSHEFELLAADSPPAVRRLMVELVEVAKESGASFFGAGDLGPVYALARRALGKEQRLPIGLAVGIALPAAAVDAAPEDPAAFGRAHFRRALPAAVTAARRLSEVLQKHGYRTLPGVPGIAHLPELVANAAGLGWIGKCGRLVTPQIGPRLAFGMVLTNAPLPVSTTEPVERRCFDCHDCIDVCPSKALSDQEFDPSNPFVTYDREKCLRHRLEEGAIDGSGACGRCIATCVCGNRGALLLGKIKQQD